MKLAASGNKTRTTILVAAMVVLGGYAVYTNLLSGPSAPAPAARTRTAGAAKPGDGMEMAQTASRVAPRRSSPGREQEFQPKLRSNKKEEQIADLSKVDPTLRLDLLAKVMEVPPAGAQRDLFQILKAPPVKPVELAREQEPKVYRFVGPPTPAPPGPPPGPPVEPPPPPINIKYYGLCAERANGKKTAYFLDGDDIIEATEGATLKGRYRIVQIGATEVQVEDTQSKRRQSLRLEPEASG